MSIKSKALAIRAMEQSMGDDLERAKSAFRNLSPQEMTQQYGHSGMTRQEIVDGYQRDRDERKEALEWLRKVPV